MAGEGNIVETTKQYAQYQLALKKSAKDQSALYIKTVALQKAFGPFYVLYKKIGANLQILSNITKAILKPFGLFQKTGEGIKMNFLLLIGVLFTIITMFAYFVSSMGDAGGGSSELMASLGELKDTIMGVIEKIKEFDFGPAIETAKGLLLEFAAIWMSIATEVVDVINWMIETFGDLVATLSELGFFDAIRAAVESMWVGIESILDGFRSALDSLGLGGQDASDTLTGAFDKFGAFLLKLGLVDIIMGVVTALGTLGLIVGIVVGKMIAKFGELLAQVLESDAFQQFSDSATWVLETLFGAFEGYVSWVQTFLDDILAILTSEDPFGTFVDIAWGKVDWLWGKLEEFWDYLTNIDIGELLGDAGDFLSGVAGGLGDMIGFSSGGVVSGPTSGYPAILHGTEAVVPLPDGQSIPVAISGGGGGGGGGGGAVFNINVNGARGDPEQIAKAVGREVQRVFKSRSRSGGYGRGI